MITTLGLVASPTGNPAFDLATVDAVVSLCRVVTDLGVPLQLAPDEATRQLVDGLRPLMPHLEVAGLGAYDKPSILAYCGGTEPFARPWSDLAGAQHWPLATTGGAGRAVAPVLSPAVLGLPLDAKALLFDETAYFWLFHTLLAASVRR